MQIALPVWFRLAEPIYEISYNAEFANQIGSSTLLLIMAEGTLANDEPALPVIVNEREARISPTLVHISDIHFGKDDHAFLMSGDEPRVGGPAYDLASVILTDVKEATNQQVGLLIVSGDITSRAAWKPMFTDLMVEQMMLIVDGLGLPPPPTTLKLPKRTQGNPIMPRIPYAKPEDLTPEVKAAVDKAPINVMRMLAGTSPAVFEAYGKYAAAFFAPGGLPPDLRELAILRVGLP